jgi:hypothetical protein
MNNFLDKYSVKIAKIALIIISLICVACLIDIRLAVGITISIVGCIFMSTIYIAIAIISYCMYRCIERENKEK